MFSSQEYLDNKEDIDKFFNTIKGKGYRALDKSAKQRIVTRFLKDRTALSQEASSFIFKILNNARMGYGLTTLEDVIQELPGKEQTLEDVVKDIAVSPLRSRVKKFFDRSLGSLSANTSLKKMKTYLDKRPEKHTIVDPIKKVIEMGRKEGYIKLGDLVDKFNELYDLHAKPTMKPKDSKITYMDPSRMPDRFR